MKWQKALKKSQLNHLKAMHCNSLQEFKLLRADQKALKALSGAQGEPCWDCRLIEVRLQEVGKL